MWKLLLIPVVLIAIIISGFWTYGAVGCWRKLSDSNYDYRYKLLKGCQYESQKNGWLNYDRLRDVAE